MLLRGAPMSTPAENCGVWAPTCTGQAMPKRRIAGKWQQEPEQPHLLEILYRRSCLGQQEVGRRGTMITNNGAQVTCIMQVQDIFDLTVGRGPRPEGLWATAAEAWPRAKPTPRTRRPHVEPNPAVPSHAPTRR
jgi:hypothetical protein